MQHVPASKISAALRQLADQVDKFPEDIRDNWIGTAFVFLNCDSVQQFREAARALGLTLTEHRRESYGVNEKLELSRRIQIDDASIHDYLRAGVQIDKNLVCQSIERPTTERVWDVPDNLLADDYVAPALPHPGGD